MTTKSTASSLSKAEYLKKYMSQGEDSKPKKKRKVQSSKNKVQVIDHDVDVAAPKHTFSTVYGRPDDASDTDEVNFKPVVANIVDERPEEVQMLENFSSSGKWKSVGAGVDDREKEVLIHRIVSFSKLKIFNLNASVYRLNKSYLRNQ